MNEINAIDTSRDSDLATFVDTVKGSQTVHPMVNVAAAFAIGYTMIVGAVMFAGTMLPHGVRAVFH